MDIVRKMVEGSKKILFFGALLKASHYAVLFFQTHRQTNTPHPQAAAAFGWGRCISACPMGRDRTMNSNLHINFDPTYPLGQDEGRLERIDPHVLPVRFKETAAFFFRHLLVLFHGP